MLLFARRLLVGLNVLNWLAALFLATILVSLLVHLPWVEARLARRHPGDVDLVRHCEQAAMLIGLATVGCAHMLFVRLIAMVDTVIAGHPFLSANARRLRDIAWVLLGIQLLDLGFGALVIAVLRRTGQVLPWTPGVTGWLAVLLLFVLARVFGEGARMQDELEATV